MEAKKITIYIYVWRDNECKFIRMLRYIIGDRYILTTNMFAIWEAIWTAINLKARNIIVENNSLIAAKSSMSLHQVPVFIQLLFDNITTIKMKAIIYVWWGNECKIIRMLEYNIGDCHILTTETLTIREIIRTAINLKVRNITVKSDSLIATKCSMSLQLVPA